MKCDELKVYHCNEWHNEYTEFYMKSDVDVSIDELKSAHHKERHEYINMIAELKAEINRKEAVEQRWFERCMEARTENIRLKRALYKACANWALSTLAWLDCVDQGEPRKWSEMRQKCLKKAEEYR